MVSKLTIQEANKHLHAMHLHSTYLENSLQECKEIMQNNEERYCSQIQKLRKEKDEKISELTIKMKNTELEKHKLEEKFKEKENEVKLLKGRLSVVKQIFQFLPGLRSFLGVIENARQLVKEDGADNEFIPNDISIKAMNKQVPSIAKHNIPNGKLRNLSISEDSDDEEITGINTETNANPDMTVKSVKDNRLNDFKTSEVYL
ncbi:uncharacterized protein LOC143043164 [Mytilus galloprovincialis]|uniref:uncharacterized protein LOC143043164 n=1 Tax=Mytilus galloprovincialis TaxID=29158 RepID=UPI003F7B8B0C